jgi:UDP-N-acetylmuramate: L-alanyl-gamma-D-glutamyl-meso-diaminopimelate ligase
MTKADLSIVYIDENTFKHKKLSPFTEIDVRKAFKDERLLFFDKIAPLEKYLLQIKFEGTNLLLMSSGNFSGMDLIKLARELKR